METYLSEIVRAYNSVDKIEVYKAIGAIGSAGVVYTAGNGGSAATASHFTQDLMKSCKINSTCLTDNISLVTAIANDMNFDDIFLFQLQQFSSWLDTVILFSYSGESRNILKIADFAKKNKIRIVGFLGNTGGSLLKICDDKIWVQHDDVRICESIHSIIAHYIVERLSCDPG